MQLQGVNVNDDARLEHEADVMGERAVTQLYKQSLVENKRNNPIPIVQRLTRKRYGYFYERGIIQPDGSYRWIAITPETKKEKIEEKGGAQAIPKDDKLKALYDVSNKIREVGAGVGLIRGKRCYFGPHIAVSVVAKKMFVAINTGKSAPPNDKELKTLAYIAVVELQTENRFYFEKEDEEYASLTPEKKALYWAVYNAAENKDNITAFGNKKLSTKTKIFIHGEQRIMDELAKPEQISLIHGRKQVPGGGERVVYIGGTKGDCADCYHAHYDGLTGYYTGQQIRRPNEERIGSAIFSPMVSGEGPKSFEDWHVKGHEHYIGKSQRVIRGKTEEMPKKDDDTYTCLIEHPKWFYW
jgi:hypothetical protein